MQKVLPQVMTRLRHHLKGTCCGSACRHCVYDHEAIPYELRGAKRFNTAFWVEVDTEQSEDTLVSFSNPLAPGSGLANKTTVHSQI